MKTKFIYDETVHIDGHWGVKDLYWNSQTETMLVTLYENGDFSKGPKIYFDVNRTTWINLISHSRINSSYTLVIMRKRNTVPQQVTPVDRKTYDKTIRPGDRVKYIGGGDTERPYFVGRVGIFQGLDAGDEVDVDFPNTEGVWGPNVKTVKISQLEKVKETAMVQAKAFEYTDKWNGSSAVIEAMYYNEKTREVFVKFHAWGSRDRVYEDVSRNKWANWSTANSVGSYYNMWIKGINSTYETDATPVAAALAQAVQDSQNFFEVTFTVDGPTTLRISADNLVRAVEAVQDKFSGASVTVTGVKAV